jgi:hypothetical protein
MKDKQTVIRIVIIGLVFLVGIVAGTIANDRTIAKNSINPSSANVPDYPKNKNGETYGSGLDAISPDTEPDLIEAYGVDGTLGYVRSTDLNGVKPKTPEEAITKQKQRKAEGSRRIPLYDVDGKTVIGVFNVSQG